MPILDTTYRIYQVCEGDSFEFCFKTYFSDTTLYSFYPVSNTGTQPGGCTQIVTKIDFVPIKKDTINEYFCSNQPIYYQGFYYPDSAIVKYIN